MKKKEELTQKQLLSAFQVYSKVPFYLSKEDQENAKVYLRKNLTLKEVLDTVNLTMRPLVAKLEELKKQNAEAQILLNKLGVTPEMWKSAEKEFKEENAKALEKAKKQFVEASKKADELKEGKGSGANKD